MQMSDKGLLMLMRHEANVLETYTDPVGVPTIGVGHTKMAGPPVPTPGLKLSFEESIELLRKDIKKYEAGVNKAVKVTLAQHEFDALVSFHFNTGQIGKASLVKKLNAGDRQGAADGLLAWNKGGGKVLPGLTKRRKEERELFLNGNYGNINSVPVWDKYPGKSRMISTVKILGTLATGGALRASAPKKSVGQSKVRRVQQMLRDLGYHEVGFVDGIPGDRTRAAIAAFEINEGMKPTGELTDQLLVKLMVAEPRKVSERRANLEVKDISDSSGVKIGNGIKVIGGLGAVLGAGGGTLDALTEDSGQITSTIGETMATANRLNGLVNTVLDVGPWVIMIILGALALWGGYMFVRHLLNGSREGRHV